MNKPKMTYHLTSLSLNQFDVEKIALVRECVKISYINIFRMGLNSILKEIKKESSSE